MFLAFSTLLHYMKNNPSFLMDLIFIITTHQDNIKIAVFIFSNDVRKILEVDILCTTLYYAKDR